MRIQHNIMAMNAYRNYTSNVSAMQKNLEKLSSGYKINRAGDDAAGLAISEKMRAQITGLETAQKNAKDGISLIQTAEGAMTEVHDMLNRMVELATQSANGTYDNTVDRAQMQKEMDQLNAEINRIADSANFNGIKLLDGSMDAADKVTVKDPVIAGEKAMVLKDLMNASPIADNSTYTQFHKDPAGSSKTSFEVSLDHVSFEPTTNDDGTVQTEVSGKLQVWVGKDSAERPKPEETNAEDGVNVLLLSYKATVGDDGKVSAESIANSIMSGKEGSADQKIRDDGTVDLKFKVPLKADGTYTTTAAEMTEIKVEYKVSLGEDGKTLKFEMTDKGYAQAAKYYKDATALANKTGTSADDKTALLASADNLFRGNFHIGVHNGTAWSEQGVSATTNISAGGVDTGVQPAIATWFMQDAFSTIKDGAGMRLGDEYYVWGMSDETVNAKYGDDVKVIDIRDLCKDGKLRKADGSGDYALADFNIKDNQDPLTKALDRMSVATKDNAMWHVEVNRDGNAVIFTEKSTNASDADLTTKKGIESQLQTVDKIMSNVETVKATGKALTLQIGDTAESFNQLKVNISDMHAAALGLDKISIADQDSAAKAVDVIKSAINQVSDVRGTLGATQNRLDHTINNLSVMQENIQDAESTIRDVDVAEEMMAYTKNNILIQSAQAMLAQANQVPQGVLQLLG